MCNKFCSWHYYGYELLQGWLIGGGGVYNYVIIKADTTGQDFAIIVCRDLLFKWIEQKSIKTDTESFLILERSIARLQLGVAGTLGGLVGGAIGAIIGLLVGVVIFATVDTAGATITISIGATVGSAVFTAIGAVLFCLIYYLCTCK